PVIVPPAVSPGAAGALMAGPLCCWVDPAAPWNQIRVSAWPTVRLSPRWPEVAERVTGLIADRLLAVADRDRLDVLRRHLSDWHPAAVIFLDELAEQASPRLARAGLDRTDLLGSLGPPGSRAGRGAVAEAHDAALLLSARITHATSASKPHRPACPAEPARQVRRVRGHQPDQGRPG